MDTPETNARQDDNILKKEMANFLFPLYCDLINCPRYSGVRCDYCSLDDIIAITAAPGQTLKYDANEIPFPLEEYADLSIKDWLELSFVMFKKNADRVIHLLVEQYHKGSFSEPQITIVNVNDNGVIRYKLYQSPMSDMGYREVANRIYRQMGTYIARAQLEQERHTPEKTSVTMSIAYLPDARIAFIKTAGSMLNKRFTKEMIDEKVQQMADEWVEETKRKKELQKKMEEERRQKEEAAALRYKEWVEQHEKDCARANERYGVDFYFDKEVNSIYGRHTDATVQSYKDRLADIDDRMNRLKEADWIISKKYKSITTIAEMCDSVIGFKTKYRELWMHRGTNSRNPDSIATTRDLIAYIPELYKDFVYITDHYAEILIKKEDSRKEKYGTAKPLVDRTKLPAPSMDDV